MSYIRFNHVFFALMVMAVLTAFVFSTTASDRIQSKTLGLFAPVAWPLNKLGGWAHDKIAGRLVRDNGSPAHSRNAEELMLENERLRVSLANLHGELEHLAEREEQYKRLGDAGAFCTMFSVMGSDSGARESLLLGGSGLAGLREKMPVLSPRGLVGRLTAAGVGGARVRLITDPDSRFEVRFTRTSQKPDGTYLTLAGDKPLVSGIGRGLMVAQIPEKILRESTVTKDDWVLLSDHDWPDVLQGYRVGYVDSIAPAHDPGFYNVTIKPGQDLSGLTEVMVMNKEKG